MATLPPEVGMLSDPKRWMWGALGVAVLTGLWLLVQWPYGDELFSAMSYGLYAADLVAILALVAGAVVALLFWRFAQVRADLLAGRRVVGRWQVGAGDFAAFAGPAAAHERDDKRGALLLIAGFVVVISGGFALFDAEAAPIMLTVAALVIVLMALAYLLSGRVMRRHLAFRSGEVIVGRDGLLVNDVLHVWGVPLSWLAGTRLAPGLMTVSYAFVIRFGVQIVEVMLPVPPAAETVAAAAAAALAGINRG